MSGLATWVDDAGFHKRYASGEAAFTALQRSKVVRAAGVSTPVARPTALPEVLIFDRIVAGATPSLSEILATLAPLHRMRGAQCRRFDPFARILPRLTGGMPAIQRRVAGLEVVDRALGWPAETVVHGDLHPGQVIRDGRGQTWLIDLDDLALGPAEADFGNLAAFLATQRPGPLPDMARQAIAGIVAEATSADPALVGHFCDIALVRRALKLRERGLDWVIRQLQLVFAT